MAEQASTSQPVPAEDAGEKEKRWGRVLICGGTDWANLGRKGKQSEEDRLLRPDLQEPHILRSLSNIKISSIHASCSGCHCIALDIDGAAWLFGRNSPAALGRAPPGVPAAEHVTPGTVSEQAPWRVTPQMLGAPRGVVFVHAATGRAHSLLVGSNGDVWSAGTNQHGQCGQSTLSEVKSFTIIKGPWPGTNDKEKIVKAAAGVSFSILLSESGKLYSLGSGEHGQLGNGRTGEHIGTRALAFDTFTEPVLVKGLQDRVITEVACGTQHSIALDSQGFVYVWGYNGYCRLGLGNQQDVLIPRSVPQFAQNNELTRAVHISAGPSNSVVIDRQKMYWMAGKWKTSGEGSGGSPYSSFRYIQDIMGCKVFHACSGGVTHFALAPDEEAGEGVMTIAFGQAAMNFELGLGTGQPKSTTKPTRHQPLIGIDIFDIAAAQSTTFFLARPNEKFADLPRHPVDVEAPELCVVCRKDTGDPLECEKCEYPYHLECLSPPLSAVPDGEWFCPKCEQKPGEGAIKKGGRKAAVEEADDIEEDEDEADENDVPTKKGASAPGRKRKEAPQAMPKPKAAKRKK